MDRETGITHWRGDTVLFTLHCIETQKTMKTPLNLTSEIRDSAGSVA